MTNYLRKTPNPFGLAGPPSWFLGALQTFDPDLVLFPSAQEWRYRLAQRVKYTDPRLKALEHYPDTKVYVQHKLIPITSIDPFVEWQRVLLDLWNIHVDRVGGAEAYEDWVDEQDTLAEIKAERDAETEREALVSEAWSDMVWAKGSRVSQNRDPRRPRTTSYQPPRFSGETGGSAVFVGPTPARPPIVMATS